MEDRLMRRIVMTLAGAVCAAMLLSAPVQAASIGQCGGGGGSQSKTLSCPAGQYVVGVFVRYASYTDRIGVRCAAFDAQGKRGQLGAFQYAGGTGGNFDASDTCSGNRGLIGLFTRAGSYVDRVTMGICEVRKAGGGFPVPSGQNASDFFNLAETVGFVGGRSCNLRCPNGEAIHRLIVRYGSWIDSIEAFCRP
jgi:hypothetical protein